MHDELHLGEYYKCTMTYWMIGMVILDAAPVANFFYCFSTSMAGTGKTKMPADGLGTLQLQDNRRLGIFQYDSRQMVGDGDAELARGAPFVQVYVVDGDLHFAKRKEAGSWVNTCLHAAAWKVIWEAGIYKSADWAMKLDADAVFLPSRLLASWESRKVPRKGGYLESASPCATTTPGTRRSSHSRPSGRR